MRAVSGLAARQDGCLVLRDLRLDRALEIVHRTDLSVDAGRIRRGFREGLLELALREVECDLRVRGDLPEVALQFVGLDADGRFDVGHLGLGEAVRSRHGCRGRELSLTVAANAYTVGS